MLAVIFTQIENFIFRKGYYQYFRYLNIFLITPIAILFFQNSRLNVFTAIKSGSVKEHLEN